MGWTFYNSNGQRLSTAATSIDVLDIDGATDIGAAIVDADLFIIDDGAGGTNRKTAASRIKTYAGTTQAVQSDIEGETNEDTYIPPDLMKYHPGIAKYWSTWEMSGEHDEYADYPSGGSVTDGSAAGNTRHTFGVTFSNANDYACVTSAGSGGYFLAVEASTRATTGVNTLCHAHDATATDVSGSSIAIFGDI